MTQPYGRLVIMHLTILLGAFVSIFLGTPLGSLLVLVVLKTALDLAFHLRQHRYVEAGTAPMRADGPGIDLDLGVSERGLSEMGAGSDAIGARSAAG